MSTEFKREDRYIVFKLADVEKDFFPSEISQLLELYETQQSMRKLNGKPPLDCVVVESDWPEYEPTWKAIEARVAGEQPAPSVPTVFVWPERPKRRQSHVLFDDGYEEGWAACVATIKAFLATAPEAKP